MKKIVSANYRDRGSGLRWLIRDENQKPEEATAVSSVIATGVVFRDSTVEYGFGCSIVAVCNTAEEADSDIDVGGERLKFSFDRFTDENGHRIAACRLLRLDPDGSMYYIGEKADPSMVKIVWGLAAIALIAAAVMFGPTILKIFGINV